MGIASMILGIVSIVIGFMPIIWSYSILIAIVGIVLGIISLVKKTREGKKYCRYSIRFYSGSFSYSYIYEH